MSKGEDFKFAVGQFVKMRASSRQVDPSGEMVYWTQNRHNDLRGQVLSRQLEECSGGIQRFYDIRWVSYDGTITKTPFRHAELELVSSEVFPPRPKKKENE